MTVNHAVFNEPQVNKTADVASVDATGGSAELHYTLTVQNVQTGESYSATIDAVTVGNEGAAAVTVDVRDRLYCDAGSGVVGTLVREVFYAYGVTIVAGGHQDFEDYGPYDISECNGQVIDRVDVYQAGTSTVLAYGEYGPTGTTETSAIVGRYLVDEETLPAGYSVTGASLTLAGADVSFSASVDGSIYTMTTNAIAAAGTYTLVKGITRDGAGSCEAAKVVNVGALDDDAGARFDSDQATIDLTCTPPPLVCTGTVGYWKAHDWPQGFDPEAPFYDADNDSGFSWRGILDEPVKGRPYVQLAYQYVAAMLNVQGNIAAAPAAVQEALNWADAYFVSHDIGDKSDKSDASYYAGILQDFNAGYYGIPHC